ncbi:MAG: stalk domain-containing protein [Bacillota bacterium]
MTGKMKLVLVLIVILSFSAGSFANASGGLIELSEVYLNNDISVVINGTLFQAKDPQDGSVYVPLTYKGRTYLPLRAVAEAVGLPVDYDADTKTAYIGTIPDIDSGNAQDVYINASPEYVDGGSAALYKTKKIDAERLTTESGKTFDFGYCGEDYRFIKPTFNCNYKYKRLKFTLYAAWSQEELDSGRRQKDTPLKVEITNEHGTVIESIEDLKHGTEMEFDIDCIDYKTLQVYTFGGSTIIGEPKFAK